MWEYIHWLEKSFFSVYYAPETVLGVKRVEQNRPVSYLHELWRQRLSQLGHNMGYKAKQSKYSIGVILYSRNRMGVFMWRISSVDPPHTPELRRSVCHILAVGEEGCDCMLMSATMGGMRSGALCTLISDRPKFKAWLWHLLNEKILGELCN